MRRSRSHLPHYRLLLAFGGALLLFNSSRSASVAAGSHHHIITSSHHQPLPSPADLVEVRRIAPGIRVDLRYATAANVFGRRLYARPRCLLRRAVAERLARVQQRLAREGFGLLIWDAYRPRSVQRVMWRIHPRGGYVGDPRHGSFHNRGAAVDLTLVHADGRPVAMPSPYDEFSPRAHLDYPHLSRAVRANRARLLRAMRAEGFIPYRREWWHYVSPEGRRYPMVDVPL
jgi:D-alanyl-D-alanine dipeptidase